MNGSEAIFFGGSLAGGSAVIAGGAMSAPRSTFCGGGLAGGRVGAWSQGICRYVGRRSGRLETVVGGNCGAGDRLTSLRLGNGEHSQDYDRTKGCDAEKERFHAICPQKGAWCCDKEPLNYQNRPNPEY